MRLRPSGWAWFGLASYVAVVDAILLRLKKTHGEPYCSMSEGFGDALAHPAKRWPVIAIWSILTVHLFGHFIPQRLEKIKSLDPLGFIARQVG